MTLTKIPVTDDTTEDDLMDLDIQLSEDAASYLSYNVLKEELRGLNTKKINDVPNMLRRLNIDVYSTVDVEQYQNTILKKLKRKAWAPIVCLVGILFSLFSFSGSIIAAIRCGFSSQVGGELLTCVAMTILFFSMFLAFTGCLHLCKDRLNERYEWANRSIGSYYDRIPEFVLETAIKIKKAMPHVDLRIEYCEQIKDPFLFICVPDNRFVTTKTKYYLEYWNEPKFKGKISDD
jgi:hypothetical protein